MTKKPLKYSEAIEEVENIINQIESNKLDIDELTEKIRRASELLKFCKQKLHFTEEEIQKIIDQMQKDNE